MPSECRQQRVAQAVVLVMHALRSRGARRIAVEDPSLHDDFRRIAGLLGMTIVAVLVDDDGIRATRSRAPMPTSSS